MNTTSNNGASPDPAPAVLLVAHGSPDPDWHRPLQRLHAELAAVLGSRVALAYLAQEPNAAARIAELAGRGHREVIIIAALLSPGGRHVKRDLPAVVETARLAHPQLDLVLVPGALGDDSEVITALAAAALRRLPPHAR